MLFNDPMANLDMSAENTVNRLLWQFAKGKSSHNDSTTYNGAVIGLRIRCEAYIAGDGEEGDIDDVFSSEQSILVLGTAAPVASPGNFVSLFGAINDWSKTVETSLEDWKFLSCHESPSTRGTSDFLDKIKREMFDECPENLKAAIRFCVIMEQLTPVGVSMNKYSEISGIFLK